MSASPLPHHATPRLRVYNPSGLAIPLNPGKKEDTPPMFQCGDQMSIFIGDDYFELPKEMNPLYWPDDLVELWNVEQRPPPRNPTAYGDTVGGPSLQTDVEKSDDGDFEPMEVFQVRDPVISLPSGQSSLASITEEDMDEDESAEDEMMEYIQSQESITSTVTNDSHLTSSSTHVDASTSSIVTRTSPSSSKIIHPSIQSLESCISNLVDDASKAVQSLTSMGSGDFKRADQQQSSSQSQPRSQTLSLSDSDPDLGLSSASSPALAVSHSHVEQSDLEGVASLSILSEVASEEASRSNTQSTLHSTESSDSVAVRARKVNEPAQDRHAEVKINSLASSSSIATEITLHAPPADDDSQSQGEPSSHDLTAASRSNSHSTITEDSEIATPEVHPSRLIVSIHDSADDLSSTPALSPDYDTSMMADTTIGTMKNDEDIFFNGDLVSESLEDFSMAKTDSEAEEDSEDEDTPMVPRLLFASAPTPVKRATPYPPAQNSQVRSIKGKGRSTDLFAPVHEVKPPKTPQRTSKSDQSRCRSVTEPIPLQSALKLAPSYHPPKALARPFFPYQTSHSRRAGTGEPSPSTSFPGQTQSRASVMSGEGTPSRPLCLLADAASDAAVKNGNDVDATWLRSETLTDIGGESHEAPKSSLVPPATMISTSAGLETQSSPMISAPSPSEAIWQKGHAKNSTPFGKGKKRGFVPPAPKSQNTIRTVPPPIAAELGIPAVAPTPKSETDRENVDVAGRHGPLESTGPSAAALGSAQVKKARRAQYPPMPESWCRPAEYGRSMHRTNSAGLKPNRRLGYAPTRVSREDTVKFREVRDERSPSPSPEPETLECAPMEVDVNESMETVSSTDSGLMGRPIASSLSPPPPEVIERSSAPLRGRGRGRGVGRGRGRGRGMTRASTSAGRESLVKSVNTGDKRKTEEDQDISQPPLKKVKATRGRSKSTASGPTRNARLAPIVVPEDEFVAPESTKEPLFPVAESCPAEDDVSGEDTRSVEERIPRPMTLDRLLRLVLHASSRLEVQPNPRLKQVTEIEAEEAESPDPLGLDSTDSFEVKKETLEEVLEERRPKVVSKQVKRSKWRPYTEGELAIILNTLGPDEQKWVTGKEKYEEILENLKNAEPSYQRTIGAIKCQVRELSKKAGV